MLLLYSFLTLFLKHSSGALAPLVWLKDYPDAKCLDGSPAAFYFQEATNAAENKKWVIHLNGGGECDSEITCKNQVNYAVGSSKYLYEYSDVQYWYFANDNCKENPLMCGWNHVQNPYCSQDLHSGQRTVATNETWGLFFSGHLILDAMLTYLDTLPNSLLDATEILFTGMSAGGIGLWMNLDYVAKRYPNARVTGATVAGHYFFATYYSGPHAVTPSLADFRKEALPQTYLLYQAYVDEDCRNAFSTVEAPEMAGLCMVSNVSLPFISTEFFIVQALTDSVVLTGHDCWPQDYAYDRPESHFMNEWYVNMTDSINGLSERIIPKFGYFGASCYIHVDFYATSPLVNGFNYYEAFERFYNNETVVVMDDCGMICNPTCAKP